MTSNTRKSKLSSGKQEQYVFTWKAINGWDYNIGEPETAASLAMANAIKLKEASTEYKKKFKQKLTFQKVFVRVVVNLIITSMMFLSMLAIYKVAQITEKDTFLKQNAVSITVGAITLLFPPIFELILKLELYRPRTALRVHLFRVLFFYLLNYFTLVYSLFIMLNTLEAEMRANEMWKREQQKMDSMTLNSLAASQYQFHIARSPTDNDWNNQSYYEVVSSPFINSKEIVSQFNSQQQQQGRPPFLLFASVSATQSGERRRDKRFFPFLFKSRVRSNKVSLHPKRKKRPKSNSNDGPKERDLSVLYGSNPFPGHELASTTPTPLPRLDPWTTVQPHFGPLFVGVSNPKAIVLPGDRVQQELGTFWESRKIGKGGGNGGNWPTPAPHPLNYTSSPKIRPPITQPYRASNYDDLCWETLIGQEVAKIVTTDLVMTVAAVMVIDFLRGLWIRYCSDWWCWDIEATFPEYGEFKVAENVLHLVNSQAMVCLGTILVPMLPLINCVKLVAVMYIRAWACMVCNVPAKQIFRASRSSNFYFWLLLAFVCMSTLPVGFVIAYKRPSKNCGPFAGQERFYSIIGKVLRQHLPKSLVEVISYFMSPGIIFPVFLILVLVIYFLVLLVSGLRAANSDLNKQLTLERTEEKRRIFELAKGKQHLAGISHKHRPSGESRKSGNGNGTTNGKINGGIEENDGLGFGKKEFNKNGKDGGGPLFFTNGSTTKTPSTTGLRKSWHGGTGGGGSGGTELSGGGTDKDFLTPFLTPKRRSPILRQYSDDSSGSSPSKSPLRHAGFLPSLASVDENEDEENEEDEEEEDDEEEEIVHGHAEAMIFRRKRSNASSQQGISSRRSSAAVQQQQRQRRKSSSTKSLKTTKNLKEIMKRPSLQLTWKDRFLLCIGWTDPIKFEEKLRAQMAENEMEKGRELGGSDEQQPLLFNGERRNKTKREKQLTTHQQLVVLEEAEYSVPSGEEEEAVGDNQLEDVEETTISPTISPTIPQEENAKIDIRKKYLNGILSGDNNSSFDVDTPIRLPSALSQGSNSSCSRVSQQQPPNVIVNKLADLYEEHPPPHSGSCSSSSSIETGSQRSWVRQQPQASNLLLHFGQLPQTNEQKFEENRQSFEREHVSESSPLVPHVQFPSEELARLSIDKRHPLPKEDIQRGSLPPLIPKRKPTTLTYGQQQAPTLNLQQNLFSRGDIRSQTANTSPQILRTEEQQVNQMNGSSSNLVLPSDLSLLLEEPSTPIGNFRPIQASEMFGESCDNKTPETASSITTNTTSTSERSDPRLQYANPYSSYAAAMCSPIEIPLEETPPIINNGRRRSLIPSTPPQQQQQYIPQKNPLYIHPLATSSLQFLQRKVTPPAIFSSKFEQEHLKQKEMAKMFHFTPQQQKKQNSSPFPSSGNDSFSLDASTSAATTKIPQHSNSLLKTKSQSPKSSILYDDNKNLSAIQRRRKQFASAFEQVPIYDQPTQQPQQYYYRSPYLLTLGDEGGSTSGRGTMPPGGYGSSPQTSESSPEFGHSKYKISSLSPGRQRREQEIENYVDSSTTSPEGSPPKRRFEIRQRSGLGLGGGIPTGNFNNSNNDKKKRDDKTPLDIKQSIV